MLLFKHLHLIIIFRIELLYTIGTHGVCEIKSGVFTEIDFNVVPVALIIPNFFTPCTNRKKSAQGFNLVECLLQFTY